MIKFKNVTKTFGDNTALDGINFTINEGEFFVLVGSSGSGKTTCLKMINRLIEPSSGEVLLEDKNVADYDLRDLRLSTGYVLQQGALFPNMTVKENISLIPELKGWDKDRVLKSLDSYLERVGLDPEVYRDRYPSDLSGGEAQRVGILRAIIARPKILLMDESFSALDPIIKGQLQDLIKDIHDELKITTVFVTHDMTEALKLGDRICIMRNGEIIQIDKPRAIKENPENKFVEEFFEGEEING